MAFVFSFGFSPSSPSLDLAPGIVISEVAPSSFFGASAGLVAGEVAATGLASAALSGTGAEAGAAFTTGAGGVAYFETSVFTGSPLIDAFNASTAALLESDSISASVPT